MTDTTPDRRPWSHAIRLSPGEWLVVMVVVTVAVAVAPRLRPAFVAPETSGDGRIPYRLSEDYWFVARYAERAVREADGVVLGDSVIWGAHVPKDRTLTHFLNRRRGGYRWANLGIDGGHPAALAGLVKHHATAVADSTVLLHLNPIWMSSPRHDLTDEKEFRFNHPDLVPQFRPRIPCYTADLSSRLGVVVRRRVGISGWSRHLQHALFDGRSLPEWSVDHPGESPFARFGSAASRVRGEPVEESVSWFERGLGPQSYPWVEPADSLQWRFFRRTIEILQRRGNRIVVLLGPVNRHMLTAQSDARYAALEAELETRLASAGVPLVAPEPPASELYADASHPVGEGYRRIAREVLDSGVLEGR
jgi:hypothetical protein